MKLAAPASVFSRSTEGHNQDKVPMGPIAARDRRVRRPPARDRPLLACRVPAPVEDDRHDQRITRCLELYRAGRLPI